MNLAPKVQHKYELPVVEKVRKEPEKYCTDKYTLTVCTVPFNIDSFQNFHKLTVSYEI